MIKKFFWLRKTLKTLNNSKSLVDKTIVFTTIRTFGFPVHQEMFLANILARKGARVVVIFDNGLYKHWDSYQVSDNKKVLNPFTNRFSNFTSFKTYFNFKLLLYFYKHSNIEVLKLKSFIDSKDILNVDIDKDDENNAISSVRRYFGCGYFDQNNLEHSKYYNSSLNNCRISKLVSDHILKNIKPNKVFTSHGIYSLWGTIYDRVSNFIPTYVYGTHVYADDEILLTDTLAQTLSLDSSWTKFKKLNTSLSEDQEKLVNDYFEKRIQHKTKDTNIYYGKIKEFTELNFPKANDSVKNIGIFPNIIWDGDVVQRDKYFNGVLDWVLKTMKFAKNSNHNFIIRFHPAEATLHIKGAKLKDIILQLYPSVLKMNNVYLIDSSTKLDTYKFIEKNIDLGLVYDGMLTMELTYMKIPVLTPSLSRFSSGGFVINPDTEEEYFTYLKNYSLISDYFKDSDKLNIEFKIYAFWFLVEAGYFMPIYDKKKFGKISFTQKTVNHLQSSRFKSLEDKLSNMDFKKY